MEKSVDLSAQRADEGIRRLAREPERIVDTSVMNNGGYRRFCFPEQICDLAGVGDIALAVFDP
jgi:hypothetical protein